jgi:hypothetical protein
MCVQQERVTVWENSAFWELLLLVCVVTPFGLLGSYQRLEGT